MGVSADVAVLVPMLGRPHAVEPVAESLRGSDPAGQARLVFLTSRGDEDVFVAIESLGLEQLTVPFDPGPGDYARKINYGARNTVEPWVFTGASDLVFGEGWIVSALAAHARAPHYRVLGTNDLGNPLVRRGRHSTHSLVRRDYLAEAVIDRPGMLYCERYRHNFCDTELVDYATSKHEFLSVRKAVVEHMHPDWRKGVLDDTYRLGKAGFREDQRLFAARQKLWRGESEAERRRLARARVSRARIR